MHFLVVGPGAMGCLFAARLKMAGFKVTLLDYLEERAALISRQGILVEGVSGDYTAKVPVVVTGKIEEAPDQVLICVKAYKTEEAGREIIDAVGPGTAVVTLQNGIGNLETLEGLFGGERVLGGVTSEGATLLGPGKIRHAGQGDTIVGPGEDSGGPAGMLLSAFNKAGFKTRVVDRVDDLIWGKLIINVGINALTAVLRVKNGRLPELAGARRIMEEAVHEAVAICKAKEIQLPYPDPVGRVMEVCRATAGNIASMLQDVLKNKMTEIEAINGAIVREGRALGIPTPVNLTLTSLVQGIQETYKESLHT